MQTRNITHATILKLVYAAVCLALCMVLPFLTGQIPEIGNMLCPLHIPVLLAGFLCGPWWAMGVGFIAPALRYLLFGMPALLPAGIPMMFELLTYGLVVGLLFRRLPRKPGYVYVSLIGGMIAGRVVWGIAAVIVYSAMSKPFTWVAFFAGAVINAIPGIILHIILIPVLVFALHKAKIIDFHTKM